MDPVDRSLELSKQKARAVSALHPVATVIGCDTLVVAPDGTLLEKPIDADDACRMLRLQSGGVSLVHSGLCLIHAGREFCDVSTSSVHFAFLSPAQISLWIATGHWHDRSGAFQIDGQGQMLIQNIEGDWTGIVGLPIFLLGALLRNAGVPVDTIPA
jgi:septum formation protein